MNKLIQSVIGALEKNKPLLEVMLGLELDYSANSLLKMERNLSEMFPFGRKVQPQVMVMLGAYLGEVIRRNVKDADISWGEEQEYISDTELRIQNINHSTMEHATSFVVKPMLRVDKFLNYDREDGLYALYALCDDICSGNIQLNDQDENQWKETNRGYRFRMTKQEKETN